MRRIIFVLSLVVLLCFSVQAQYYYERPKSPNNEIGKKPSRDFDRFYFFSWDINKPTSNTDFVNQTSSLGTRLGLRKRLSQEDKLWGGVDLGWAVYKQYFPYQTIQLPNQQAISTDWYDYVYCLNLTASVDYFFLPMEKVFTPYAGFGFGASYNKFSQYYNINEGSGTSWGLLLRPEAGFLVGFKKNSSWRVKAAFHYDYASNKNSDFGYKNFINYGFQVGIVKMAW